MTPLAKEAVMIVRSIDSIMRLGAVLFLSLLLSPVLTATPTAAQPSPSATASDLPCRDGGPNCIGIGFTDAWFNGQTVQLEFSHRFFCSPTNDASDDSTACQAGQAATTPPPSGPVV